MKEKNKERRKIEGEIYNSPVQPIMNWIYLFSTFIHENRKEKHKLTNSHSQSVYNIFSEL